MSITIKAESGRSKPWGSYDPGRGRIEVEGDTDDIKTWFVVLHEIGHALLGRAGCAELPKPMLSGREIIRQELMAWRIGASMLKPEFLNAYAEFALSEDNFGSYVAEYRGRLGRFKDQVLRMVPLRLASGRLRMVQGNIQDRTVRAFVSMIVGFPVGSGACPVRRVFDRLRWYALVAWAVLSFVLMVGAFLALVL